MYKRRQNSTEVAVQPEPFEAGWLATRDIPWSSKGNSHKGDELARRGLVWTGRLQWKCGWLAPRSLGPRFRSSNQSQLSTRYRIEHSTEKLDTNGLQAQLSGAEIMPLRRIRLNSRIWEKARQCRQLSTFAPTVTHPRVMSPESNPVRITRQPSRQPEKAYEVNIKGSSYCNANET